MLAFHAAAQLDTEEFATELEGFELLTDVCVLEEELFTEAAEELLGVTVEHEPKLFHAYCCAQPTPGS